MVNPSIFILVSFLAQSKLVDAEEQSHFILSNGERRPFVENSGVLSWPEGWREVVFAPRPITEGLGGTYLFMPGGQVFSGSLKASDGNVIKWLNSDLQLAVESSLLFVEGFGEKYLNLRDSSLDVLLTSDRQFVKGYFLSAEDKKIVFENEHGAQSFEWNKDCSIRLAPSSPYDIFSYPHFILLKDGSWLIGEILKIEEEVSFQGSWGQKINVPKNSIVKVVRRSTAEVDLPSNTSSLGIEGYPLFVANDLFPFGLPVSGRSSFKIEILQDVEISVRCGVDDRVLGFERPVPMFFELWVDDKLSAKSPLMVGGAKSVILSCSVSAGQSLTFKTVPVVEPSPGAYGNWLMPIFYQQ